MIDIPPIDPSSISTPPADAASPAKTSSPISTHVGTSQPFTLPILQNPYFSAGFGLLGVGTGLALLRRSTAILSTTLRRRILTTLEITSQDKSYPWVLSFLTSSPKIKRYSSHVSVETRFEQHDSGASLVDFEMVPGIGRHWVKYAGNWLMLQRERESRSMDLRTGSPFETLQITTLASRKTNVLTQLLQDSKHHLFKEQEGKTVIYSSYGPDWRVFGRPRRKRPLESVVLKDGARDEVVQDVQRFLSNWKWYQDRGIPYRRGYLFHGPPGTGKSSFIQALAGELEYNICILNIAERGLTDDRLNHLLTVMPARSFMLLEDVDAALPSGRGRQDGKEGFTSMVTFSGLLNALDGVAAAEERIIFMTTNHLSRLDPALIRPGRVDLKVHFGNADDYQVLSMFRRFYDKNAGDDVEAHQFLKLIRQTRRWVSPAELQGHFVRYRDDPDGAVANVEELGRE